MLETSVDEVLNILPKFTIIVLWITGLIILPSYIVGFFKKKFKKKRLNELTKKILLAEKLSDSVLIDVFLTTHGFEKSNVATTYNIPKIMRDSINGLIPMNLKEILLLLDEVEKHNLK